MSAIRTAALTKRYRETLALSDLNLDVAEGEVYGYLGPNGAGKTTTIRLLLGLHRPTGGSAELFGVDAWADPVRAHRRVAYVAGEPFLWPALTSQETFEFLARLRGGTDVGYRDELAERFQLDVDKKIRALSKGNRQKVQLVAALATRADLLLLDEPTSGLDPLMEVAFRDCIKEAKERGQTVFLSSHILSEVEALCDRVGILRRGELVDEGTLAQLRHLGEHTVEATFSGAPPRSRRRSPPPSRRRSSRTSTTMKRNCACGATSPESAGTTSTNASCPPAMRSPASGQDWSRRPRCSARRSPGSEDSSRPPPTT